MSSHQTQQVRTHIRWMIRRDMPEVLAIEAASFEFPWLEDDFIRCLRQRNCIGMVAEHDDRVVGFMIYELNKSRIQVLNFATAPDAQRRGVGTQMVRKLIGKLSAQRRTRILLEVRKPIWLLNCSSGTMASGRSRFSATTTKIRRKTRT